jgi:hypothetical protein
MHMPVGVIVFCYRGVERIKYRLNIRYRDYESERKVDAIEGQNAFVTYL